jgi:L-malate glycosyltransferase
MKVLVFAHQLEVGGTQTNALELAAELRDSHGFEVVLFATPGPAVALAHEKRLRFVAAPDALVHPSPARVHALRETVRRERPDVIHAWDWWQCIDAYYVEHLLKRVPLVVSDMFMTLTRVLPKKLPTTFGTPELVSLARAAGRSSAELLLPPVNVQLNAPAAVDPGPFRRRWNIGDEQITLASVSRLTTVMKAEGLRRTIQAVKELGNDIPLKFVIVGDGPGRHELEQLASDTNRSLGRPAVVLTGQMLDPRPAYAAADIVVGMGGSSLRGMAFAKPVLIVGENGFSARFGPETERDFHYKGMYGLGDGDPSNTRMVDDIRRLADNRDCWPVLGKFSREFVVRHFGLATVSAQLAAILRRAARTPISMSSTSVDGLRTAAVLLRERGFLSHRLCERLKS